MLFSYSELGFHDNWLHDILIEILTTDMDRIDGGQKYLAWPNCIPAAHKNKLRNRTGLRDRRIVLLDSYQELTAPDRIRVREAMSRHNALPAILDDNQPCIGLDELPVRMRDPIKKFFEFAFDLLTDLGLRDDNYKRLYAELKYKVCAFCGVEILDAPGQKREALDHYLPISAYSFAGVNFRNLAPMGTKCNSRYKHKQDILIDPASKNRRASCDPYNSPTLTLSLKKSRPFEGQEIDSVICPDWVIEWDGGNPQKLQTWDSVFAISERYRESSLNPNFRGWIDHFSKWAALQPAANTPHMLRDVLRDFAATIISEGLADSAFLRRATIQMLAEHCDDTEEGLRLFDWLNGLIVQYRPIAA